MWSRNRGFDDTSKRRMVLSAHGTRCVSLDGIRAQVDRIDPVTVRLTGIFVNDTLLSH